MNYFGQEEKIDMWTQGIYTYNEKTEYYYYTTYHWKVY